MVQNLERAGLSGAATWCCYSELQNARRFSSVTSVSETCDWYLAGLVLLLFVQSVSPWNQRTFQKGGSFQDRRRLPEAQ